MGPEGLGECLEHGREHFISLPQLGFKVVDVLVLVVFAFSEDGLDEGVLVME